MLVHVVLVLLLVNVIAAGECVARINCKFSVVGDTDCFSVVVIIWCFEEEFNASTAGKYYACAAAAEFCLLLVNMILQKNLNVLLSAILVHLQSLDECICCW